MKRFSLLFLMLAAFSPVTRVLGCAACFGASDSPMAHGMNWGIAVLLGVITTMLALVASFFVFVIRRGQNLPSEEAPVLPPPPV